MQNLVAVLDNYPNDSAIVANVLFALLVASEGHELTDEHWKFCSPQIIRIVKEGGHMRSVEVVDNVAGLAFNLYFGGIRPKASLSKVGLHVDFMSAIFLWSCGMLGLTSVFF